MFDLCLVHSGGGWIGDPFIERRQTAAHVCAPERATLRCIAAPEQATPCRLGRCASGRPQRRVRREQLCDDDGALGDSSARVHAVLEALRAAKLRNKAFSVSTA